MSGQPLAAPAFSMSGKCHSHSQRSPPEPPERTLCSPLQADFAARQPGVSATFTDRGTLACGFAKIAQGTRRGKASNVAFDAPRRCHRRLRCASFRLSKRELRNPKIGAMGYAEHAQREWMVQDEEPRAFTDDRAVAF